MTMDRTIYRKKPIPRINEANTKKTLKSPLRKVACIGHATCNGMGTHKMTITTINTCIYIDFADDL